MAAVGTPPKLTLGTKETVPIRLNDSLANLTDLTGKDLRYDLIKEDEAETPIVVNAVCGNDGMTALPLIDTTAFDDDDEGYYNIFLTFTNGSEEPRLGPFRILVDD